MPITPTVVRSVAKFVDWVASVSDAFLKAGEFEGPWFRGVGSEEFHLIPGLYRCKAGKKPNADDELRSEFMRKGLPLAKEIAPRNDWEWYFIMQHYRVPTRLLDWTDGALIALYFAVTNAVAGKRPAVWALNPLVWNNRYPVVGPADISDDFLRTFLPRAYYHRKRIPKYPVAVDPPFVAERMMVQRSHFTLHGRDPRGLDQMNELRLAGKLFKAIIEPTDDELDLVRQKLNVLGITQTTIFPDLEGLAIELKLDYQIG